MKRLLMPHGQAKVVSTNRQNGAAKCGVASCLALLISLYQLVAAANYLRIESGTNQGFVVRAGAFDSRPYLLQAGTNLAGTNWVTIAAITNTDNEIVVSQIPPPGETHQFFKIAEQLGLRAPTRYFAPDPSYPIRIALRDSSSTGSNEAQTVTITSLPATGELRDLVSVGLTNSEFLRGSNGWTSWVAQGLPDFDFGAAGHYTTGGPDLRISFGTVGGVAGVYQKLSLIPGNRYRIATRFTEYTNTASAEIWLGPTPPLQGSDYGPNTDGANLLQTIPFTSAPLAREFVASTNQLYLLVKMFSSGPASGCFDFIRSYEVRPITAVPYTVLNDRGELEYTSNSSDRESYRFQYTLTRVSDGLTSSPGQAQTSDELSFTLNPEGFQGTEDHDLFFQIPGPRFSAAANGESVLLARPLFGKLFQVENDHATLGPVIKGIGERVWNPDGWLCFRPNPNAFGAHYDSFSFMTIFPNDLFADEAWVWMDVAPVPDPPVAFHFSVPVYNGPAYFYPSVNDPDSFPLKIVFTRFPTNGQLYPNNTVCRLGCSTTPYSPTNAGPFRLDNIVYYPTDLRNTNFSFWSNFTDHASYYLEDETGLRSAEATINFTIELNWVNLPPIPSSPNVDIMATNATPSPIFVDTYDLDSDKEWIRFLVLRYPTNGILIEGSYYVDPRHWFVIDSRWADVWYFGEGMPWVMYVATNLSAREDSVIYTMINDDEHSESGFVVTQVVHLVHVPFARNQTITNNWNTTIPIKLDVFDPDGLPISYEIINEPTNGVLMGLPNAGPLEVFYQPRSDYFGIDHFSFRGVRGDGTTGNVATVSVTNIIPVPANLIHRWRFDGNSVDVVSNYDGKIQGNAQFVTGKVGSKALRFDGVDDYVQFGRTNLPPPWTLTMWVRREDSPDPSAALFMDDRYALKLEQFGVTNRPVGFTAFGSADYAFHYTAPTNTWTQLSFVGTPSETRLYVNGVLNDSVAVSIPLPRSQLGRVPTDRLKGALDDVQTFNRELSAMEILGIYYTTK